MALSKAQALDAVKNLLVNARSTESQRLERIHTALKPRVEPWDFTPSAEIPADAPKLMKELARKSETNYLPLLVKTFAQVIKADGYLSESDAGAVEPWQWWQRNRMDSRQTGLTRSALQYGAAYAAALPGTYGRGESGPSISLFSPREMTAVYQDPEADEWPMLAVAVDGNFIRLFDEEQVYSFTVEQSPLSGPLPIGSLPYAGGALTYVEPQAHGLGVCPVVRYRDRNLLSGEEQLGIVEPLLTVQERINESTFQAQVTAYFQAFKQRYVLGWMPKDEIEELKAGAARIWYLDADPADVKIDQLDGGTVDLELRNAAIRDFAAIGQVPAQALGIDGISNISDATLAGLEAAKNREAGEITTSMGESHEQLMRLCAFIDGNESAANDYASEVRWKDFETRSYAQTVDGLVKVVQGMGLPAEIALEDLPGMTDAKLKRARDAIRATQARATLDGLRQSAASARAEVAPVGDAG